MTTLQVRTSQPRVGRTQYSYELRSGSGLVVGPLEQEHTVNVSQDLVKGLCREIDGILKTVSDGPALQKALIPKGRLLYDALFPRQRQPELVRQLRESTGPLLVQSNESLVPWELLHDGEDFLGLTHDLGRRTKVDRPVVDGRSTGQVTRALVVGDTLDDLPGALLETRRVSEWLTERGVDCTVLTHHEATLTRVIGELADEQEPYDLFHFSGHVSGVDDAAGLMMHNRQLIDGDALQPLAGRGVPPVVFVNGCASAEPTLDTGARAMAEAAQTMSACMSFMVMGAKTVVGTRTPVGDDSALRFAEAFYGQLRDHVEAGTAMREARSELARDEDGSWASFVLYGDPGARITTAAARTAAPDPEPAEPGAPVLTNEADELMRRTEQFAALRGLVTSVDLLTALLGTDDVRDRAAARVGSKRLDLLTEVLRQLQSQAPGTGVSGTGTGAGAGADTGSWQMSSYPDTPTQTNGTPVRGTANGSRGTVGGSTRKNGGAGAKKTAGGGVDGGRSGRIERSDTIVRVLDGARAAVRTAGRSAITVDDIAAAFLETGGGSCAELLQLFGIRPDRLLSPETPRRSEPEADELDLGLLGPRAAAAVQCARLLAAVRGEKVSTYLLLQAFAVAGSDVLGDALADQGEEGAAAFRRLSRLGRAKPREFSSRTLSTLRSALQDGGDPVGEEVLLAALLADEESSARELLTRLGVEPELVLDTLRAAMPPAAAQD